METTIELMANEFTAEAFQRIKSFLMNKSDARVFISISHRPKDFPPIETREDYFNRLDSSIKDAEEGKVTAFTWDPFNSYARQLPNETSGNCFTAKKIKYTITKMLYFCDKFLKIKLLLYSSKKNCKTRNCV